MSSPAPAHFTEAEYIALERVSDRKHEYVAGNIVAMAGARPPHNLLSANILSHPYRGLRRGHGTLAQRIRKAF